MLLGGVVQFVGCAAGNYGLGRNGYAPEMIVLHRAEGTFEGCRTWFNTPPEARPRLKDGSLNRSAAHFSVALDGRMQQHVSLADTAYANGIVNGGAAWMLTENAGVNPNLYTISIEAEGWHYDPLPQAQRLAIIRLCVEVWRLAIAPGSASHLAVDRNHIGKHSDFDIVDRANCPGWFEAVQQSIVNAVAAQITAPPAITLPDAYKALRGAYESTATGLEQESARVIRLGLSDAGLRLSVMAEQARLALARFGGWTA